VKRREFLPCSCGPAGKCWDQEGGDEDGPALTFLELDMSSSCHSDPSSAAATLHWQVASS
jgi:hypothetical protein